MIALATGRSCRSMASLEMARSPVTEVDPSIFRKTGPTNQGHVAGTSSANIPARIYLS
jgi:hypothetical protein